MAAITPSKPEPAMNFRCVSRGLVARLSLTLIVLQLLPLAILETNHFTRVVTSSRLSHRALGRPWDAHRLGSGLQKRPLEVANGLRNETLLRAAAQIPV